MDVTPLLNRLEGVRQTGPGTWVARCPSHEDRTPSLSIRDAGDRVLIYCFAGCAAGSVLDAIGLKWTDLYPDPWKASYHRATARGATKLPPVDLVSVDRMILRIAAARLKAGKELTLEDAARLQLARERLRIIRGEAA